MTRTSRRQFTQSVLAGAAALSASSWTGRAAAQSDAANEKLQLACIGTANRAAANIAGVRGEDVVALCDVDSTYLAKAKAQHPDAETFADYRELIESMADRLDGVVVSTPDHHHAPATLRAIRAGLHVYCEKPLTHTVHEARVIREAAAEAGVVTQMGTQIHAGQNYHRVVAAIRDGVIGEVSEVHCWDAKSWAGFNWNPTATPSEPPANVDWDLWCGPSPKTDYVAGKYHPADWRRWWDYGQGTLGDMGCHLLDLPFWALELTHPTSVMATASQPPQPQGTPTGATAEWQFPAAGDRGPVLLAWYDGDNAPSEIAGNPVPKGAGIYFLGSEGNLYAHYGKLQVDGRPDYVPPEPETFTGLSHHADWINAIKTGGRAACDFAYSGRLTETVLLGNVAYRAGEPIEWDADALRVTGNDDANRFVRKEYRKGWKV